MTWNFISPSGHAEAGQFPCQETVHPGRSHTPGPPLLGLWASALGAASQPGLFLTLPQLLVARGSGDTVNTLSGGGDWWPGRPRRAQGGRTTPGAGRFAGEGDTESSEAWLSSRVLTELKRPHDFRNHVVVFGTLTEPRVFCPGDSVS